MSKRILVVGNFLSSANRSRGVCEDLALRLAANGWQVTCTSAKSGRIARLGDMLWTVSNKRQHFALAHVDVYSGAAFRWAEAVCWLLRRQRKPYVLTVHGGNLPQFAHSHPLRVAKLLRDAHAVTAPSRFLLESLKTFRADIQLLSNPLDIARYHFIPRALPSPRLVWLRAFESIYNPVMAVRTAAILTEKLPGFELLMIGPDKGDGSLQAAQRAARDLGVADRCRFQPGVAKADVPNWLNRGDIFLNTTNVDNTPVSVMEALACGLPVVSTNVGGMPYLLEDGLDALLVPPDDVTAMAAAVLRLCCEPGLSQRLSHAGRAKTEQFDWSVILPRWEALLASVAESHHAASVLGG